MQPLLQFLGRAFRLLLAAGVASSCHAFESGAAVSPSYSRYDAVERTNDGPILDEEHGHLQGTGLKTWIRAGRHRFEAAAERSAGAVDYRGATQWGLPVNTRSRIAVTVFESSYRYGVNFAGLLRQGALFAAAGRRRLERDILPTLWSSRLTETLDWNYARLGVDLEWPIAERLSLVSRLGAEAGIDSTLAVDFHGLADGATLHPGSRRGYEAALGLEWRAARNFTLACAAAQHRQDYGESSSVDLIRAGRPAGRVWYPGSRQTTTSVSFTLAYQPR